MWFLLGFFAFFFSLKNLKLHDNKTFFNRLLGKTPNTDTFCAVVHFHLFLQSCILIDFANKSSNLLKSTTAEAVIQKYSVKKMFL